MEQQLILNRYRPLEDLGEGGFGSVVLAWDTRIQRRVAIKRLPLPAESSAGAYEPTGLAEARTAAMLGHPSIVTVFDFDTDSDEAFLVMEYIEGAPLADILEDVGGSLTLDEAAAIFSDVSEALAFAHDNGVLHLDIKPENVLVTRDGRAKVADFGMAELSGLAGHGPAYGGTLGYMPLEQLTGDVVSERTDEWALAAMTYEMLTGHNPFAGSTAEQTTALLRSQDPPLPSEYGEGIGPAIDDILLAALGPEPDERYETVADFSEALLPYLGDRDEGRRSLAEITERCAQEDLDEEPGLAAVGAWDRLRGPIGRTLGRGVAGVEAAWLAWVGLAPFALDAPAYVGAVALVAAAALFAPGLGIGLGLGCLVVGALVGGAWLVGMAVLVAGGTWWWFVARRETGAAVLPLAAPILGMARIPVLHAALAGFSLRPLAASVTALLGGALAMLAAAASAQGPPYFTVWPGYAIDVWNADLAAAGVLALATSPAAYMTLAGWGVAAAVLSWCCGRATRGGALLGTLLAFALLVATYLGAEQVAALTGAQLGWTGPELTIGLGVSFALMLAVVALGAPVRSEEE